MTTLSTYPVVRPGPLHGTLLAGTVPLFLGALLSDIAYGQTYQIQWANFASWLIAARTLADQGRWPSDWPEPPSVASMRALVESGR